MTTTLDWLEQVERDGYAVLQGVFSERQVDEMCRGLGEALHAGREDESAIRGQGGVYAARNVLTLWPEVAQVWRQAPLPAALAEVLGSDYGLVRVLFFDKPPEQTWALPWHKDLTIAVRDNRRPSAHFQKPTTKAGVPHVEAPQELLEKMLTVRLHLDDITEENGPLKVLPGSHHAGKEMRFGTAQPRSILVCRGDVLLIRPLLSHCSNRSHPETRRHRRILHLEFAAGRQLPDDYEWHAFCPL